MMGWGWGCPAYGAGGSGWSIWGMLPGLLLFLGLLIIVILSILWLIRRSRLSNAAVGSSSSDPIAIAKRRLAAGEIGTEEYEEIRDRIQS
jgi:uncharacterized membrane protein